MGHGVPVSDSGEIGKRIAADLQAHCEDPVRTTENFMFALGSEADIKALLPDVRFTSESGDYSVQLRAHAS